VNPKGFLSKIAVYLAGLFLLALGTVCSINAGLGISPINALPYAAGVALGVEVGGAVTAFFLACILAQALLLGRRFKPVELCQAPFSFVFGWFVQGISSFLALFPAGYAGRAAMLVCGMLLIAAGIAVYLEASLVNLPPEGLVLAILQRKPSWKFGRVKIALDSSLVLAAVAISLVFTGSVQGVREGTVLSALCIGRLIPPFRRMLVPLLGRLGFHPAKPPAA